MKILPPQPNEYPEFYARYIGTVSAGDLIPFLKKQRKKVIKELRSLSKAQLTYRYEPGKWSIKQIILHFTDAERIFAYRALCFARNDSTALPGFDEDAYAVTGNADERSLKELLKEFDSVRRSSISLFECMNEEIIERTGTANENHFTVRGIGYCIAGHCQHHMTVIQKRYLDGRKKEKKRLKKSKPEVEAAYASSPEKIKKKK
jgi:hypothetical protein